MYIGYSEEQEQLRRELRAYYDKLLTPEVEEGLAKGHGIGPVNRQVVRQMGEDGWLGIGWPKEYGGQGRSAIEQFIFFDESMRAGAPVPMLTINTVGPTIMDFGTHEQKAEFLPKILKGEIHFCIGYTEPGAGTDLAALTTKAVRDGDEYVINGQKMFTSLAGGADYCWLAVRTDPEAKKHKGISMLIVPMDTPGIKLMPMDLMSDHDINQVFYDDVRVPASALVGNENNGWGLITSQLNRRGSSSARSPTRAAGRKRRSSRTGGASSTRNGCRSTSPASTHDSSSCASRTGRWRGTRPRGASTSPTLRRSRSSGPSSTSRRSA
jgi:3-oxocholest-4-en-26-oyl-CoA dehydrogenase alpha subunit